MNENTVREQVYAIEDYIIGLRRQIHTMAEPAGMELETIAFIKAEYGKIGIEMEEVEHGGLIGVLEGSAPGKTILLRADCDALPMPEAEHNLKGPRTCISKNAGAMHACGHDGHMAMQIAAARLLAANRDKWKGRVILAVERGEEIGWGANRLLDRLRQYEPIDGCWGVHLFSELPVGKVSVEAGSRMAAPVAYAVKLTGRGGHGSRPDLCVNPLDAFSDIYASVKEFLAVKLNPFSPVTSSVGSIEYGTVGNIIPDTLTFKGSFRLADFSKTGKAVAEGFRHIVRLCSEKHGVEYELTLNCFDMAVINNADCSDIAKGSVEKVLGADAVGFHEPWMASEGFGMYLKYWPGVYAFVGIENEAVGSGAPHHNTSFDIDEAALAIGTCCTLQYALDFLSSDAPIFHVKETRSPDEMTNAL